MVAVILKVLVEFIEAVGEATLASVRAVIYLPRNIGEAVKDYQRSKKLDAEMEAALIDPEFLNRASMGITEDESSNIKSILKDMRNG